MEMQKELTQLDKIKIKIISLVLYIQLLMFALLATLLIVGVLLKCCGVLFSLNILIIFASLSVVFLGLMIVILVISTKPHGEYIYRIYNILPLLYRYKFIYMYTYLLYICKKNNR